MTNNTTNMGSASTISNSGHLADYEFLPAVIVETDDPMNYGRIKVSALGAYNAGNSSTAQLPWCYPFTMHGNNTYSSYEKGSKVWLLRNTKRQDENWFIPMYEHHAMTQDFIDGSDPKNKPEVISMRNNGGSQSSITYDHSGGYNISTGGSGGGALLNVGTDSSATMSGGGSAVNTSGSGVTLGSPGEDEHPAVLGDKLSDLIYDILSALQIFSTELGAQDPLARIPCENLNVEIQRIYLDIEKILSEKVKICETTADDKAKKEQAAAQAKQEKEAKAAAEKNAAAQKAVKEKMAKGEKLTSDEYNSLSVTDKFAYDTKQGNSLWTTGTAFNTDIQGQLAQYRAQYAAQTKGQSQQTQQNQQKQINKQQNVAVSDNTSVYNRPAPAQISVSKYPIPTVNQILGIGQ